jgi:metal-responsive CopG/Arc/MetJ family transcriptional regulator
MGSVQRSRISLPEPVVRRLDQMVAERGLDNRSKAIAEMIPAL